MKTRFFASAVIAVLLLNVVGIAASDVRRAKAKKRQAARLVALLPASDGVAVFDAKRFLNDALPKVLSANQPMLGLIMAKISEMENRTGIDLRKFDQVAVGVAIKQVSAKEVDFEPVAIASGDISSGALAAIVKHASNGIYREEKIGGRTVYVFTAKAATQKAPVKTTNSKIASAIDKGMKGLTKEIAVTALDRNTLVLGSLGRVRETLEAGSHVGTDVSGLLFVTETSVLSFASRTPAGMSKMLPLDIDKLGADIDSIKYMSGSLDVANTGASLQMMARTTKPEQALGLKDMIDVLQIMGGGILGNSKRADQKVYGRMLKNAKVEVRGTDVTLDLTVPQSDIDILIAGIK